MACVKMLGTNSFLLTGTLLLYFFFSWRGNGLFLSNFVFPGPLLGVGSLLLGVRSLLLGVRSLLLGVRSLLLGVR